MAKYVIHYTLEGQRRWDFAQLEQGTFEEAAQALRALHGDTEAETLEVTKVTKAL